MRVTRGFSHFLVLLLSLNLILTPIAAAPGTSGWGASGVWAAAPASNPSTGTGTPRGRARLAPDLLETISKRSPNEKVRLIATLNGFNAREIEERVQALGGEVRGAYPSV
ncbi:MAG TPA: hypothetical protein VFT43_03310, partial [Candidatus Polarisedimenticolia bacterium]|nr:hypothetical protein [Candidatus Polarisedimenticolia bacterium]